MAISFSKSKDVGLATIFWAILPSSSTWLALKHTMICTLLCANCWRTFFTPLYINPVMNTCACGLADSARCSRFNEMLVCTQELQESQRVFLLWVLKVLCQRNTSVTLSDGVLELSCRTPADPIKTFAWMCLYMHLWCAWVCCLWRILGWIKRALDWMCFGWPWQISVRQPTKRPPRTPVDDLASKLNATP